ncbi:MAG: metalloregulator ArsR/SmtB family transcription factor [Minwuia sp.]|nr:metalloregulator ArsR/SmtB family transcription factor [Minwuia sp.]
MDNETAAEAFGAMGHPSRIQILRYLVERGRDGADASTMVRELEIAWTTLSHHLDHLKRSALITATRDGRRMVHRAEFPKVALLSSFLMQNCCAREEKTDETPARSRRGYGS